jgi:hypothetical protein
MAILNVISFSSPGLSLIESKSMLDSINLPSSINNSKVIFELVSSVFFTTTLYSTQSPGSGYNFFSLCPSKPKIVGVDKVTSTFLALAVKDIF